MKIHFRKKLGQSLQSGTLIQFNCHHLFYAFRVSSLPTYYVPKDGPLSSYKEYVSMLPNIDHPEAFGQHPNADITSQIQETRLLFGTLLSLQPQVSTGGGESREDKVTFNYCKTENSIITIM